jgi:hypothetical protein
MAASAPARAERAGSPPPQHPSENRDDDGLRLTFGLGAAAKDVSTHPRFALPFEGTVVSGPFSASAGAVLSSLGVDEAYGELGIWVGVDVGLGIGYGQRETSHGAAWSPIGHVFLGVPIPLAEDALGALQDPLKRYWLPYLLPYYRPSWDLRTRGVSHEVGLMLKMSYTVRGMRVSGFTDL